MNWIDQLKLGDIVFRTQRDSFSFSQHVTPWEVTRVMRRYVEVARDGKRCKISKANGRDWGNKAGHRGATWYPYSDALQARAERCALLSAEVFARLSHDCLRRRFEVALQRAPIEAVRDLERALCAFYSRVSDEDRKKNSELH